MTDSQLERVLQNLEVDLQGSLERLFEILRLLSVGTDPASHADGHRAAGWLKSCFESMGFNTSVEPSSRQPVVLATYEPPKAVVQGRGHVPHVLFYGHYGVQPADPLELWTSPPFEPQVRPGKDGRPCIYARGVADDKGQVMTFVEASRVWLATQGHLPCRVTFLIGDDCGFRY